MGLKSCLSSATCTSMSWAPRGNASPTALAERSGIRAMEVELRVFDLAERRRRSRSGSLTLCVRLWADTALPPRDLEPARSGAGLPRRHGRRIAGRAMARGRAGSGQHGRRPNLRLDRTISCIFSTCPNDSERLHWDLRADALLSVDARLPGAPQAPTARRPRNTHQTRKTGRRGFP